MSGLLDQFSRNRKGRPCPVCGHDGWCITEYDSAGEPLRALCKRIPSPRQWREAGWLHVLRDDGRIRDWPRVTELRTVLPIVRVHERMRHAHERFASGDHAARAARDLGVSAAALLALGTGIEWRTLLFPMKDDRGRMVGIRTRTPDAKKRTVQGGRNGLFLPRDLARDGDVYVCEGPTDAAALLGLGLQAIGRASAGSCTAMCTRLVASVGARRAVVVADNDDVGRSSAVSVALALRVVVRDVRVVVPPIGFKDARDWVRGGASAESVHEAVERSEQVGLVLERGWS